MSIRMALLSAVLAGLVVADNAAANDRPTAEAAITAAKVAQRQAAAVGGEWRDTGPMIDAAEKAADAGDFGTAIELAKKAEKEGLLGRAQAMDQMGVGNPTYLYK
jgi:hypothetical protein